MNSKSSSEKVINLLTVCRRAGRLVMGFDSVKDKMMNGEVFLVLTASDISPKTKKEVLFIAEQNGVPVIEIETDMDGLWKAIGRRTGIIGINDEGFSNQFGKILSLNL